MGRVLSRLFLLLGSLSISFAVSLWWMGARSDEGSRLGVTASLLDSESVRPMLLENLANSIAEQEGSTVEEVSLYLEGLSEPEIRELLELAYGQYAIGGSGELTGSGDQDLLPGVALLASLRDLSDRAPGFLVLSLAAAGGGFLFASDRRRVLRVIGRSWIGAASGVLLLSLVAPWFLRGRSETWAVVMAAWLDRDWDLRFPWAVASVGAVAMLASLLVPRPQPDRAAADQLP